MTGSSRRRREMCFHLAQDNELIVVDRDRPRFVIILVLQKAKNLLPVVDTD